MRHYKRTHNGRFISKKQIARRELRKLLAIILLPVAFGALSHYVNTPVVFDSGWEPHTAEAFEPSVDPCTLRDVVCDGEADAEVEKAIRAVSDAIGREVTDTTKERIAYLHKETTRTGAPFFEAVKLVYCESMWMNVQSGVVRRDGTRENSWGLAQIFLDAHTHITRDQALDPHFALTFIAERWHDVTWYGLDRNTGTCTNGLTINL